MTETSLNNGSKPVQMIVRKQGRYERGFWSTRILTVDIDAGTVIISRKGRPEDVLYHAINVENVQMWPHYASDAVESRWDSLKAKMSMCITGTEVSPTKQMKSSHSEKLMSRRGSSLLSPPSIENSLISSGSTAAGPSARTTAQKKRSLLSLLYPTWQNTNPRKSSWLIQFTSIDSYELAVMLFLRFKDAQGVRRQIFNSQVAHDLALVKAAWAEKREVGEATASLPISQDGL